MSQNTNGSRQNGKRSHKVQLPNIVKLLLQKKYLQKHQVEYAVRVHSKLETRRPLLEVIIHLGYVTEEQVREAIQEHRLSIRLGDLLVELGVITDEDLQAAIQIQKEQPQKKKLGEILVEHHHITETKLIETLSLQLGFPHIEPSPGQVDKSLAARGDFSWYHKNAFIPLRQEGRNLLVAFADPLDHNDLELAYDMFKMEIVPVIARKHSILEAVKRVEREIKHGRDLEVTEDSAVGIVNSIIKHALDVDASDIHLEPFEDRLRVRLRKDGVLTHHKDYPRALISPITSRLKILCQANIAEKRRHQGGRFVFDHTDGQVDIRISFYITIHGEKIVLRLLNQAMLLDIKDLGMPSRMLTRFMQEALDIPSGVTIITGPTGSGKTTTVYSCINYLNTPQTSIITAEDPVEYCIDGISQCSIDPAINLTYEETLRHIVRQDPDIVVIGEIRDAYSAEVAVQTALTGHKVLTTFHTEDSIGGLVRLLNMDIEAFLISTTVVSVVAQRLVRRVCPKCRAPYSPHLAELRRLGYTHRDVQGARFMKGKGCAECSYTGYQGREAVFELLFLNESVRDALLAKKSSQEIRDISLETTGLVTLMEAGLIKAAKGMTTLEELLRCLPLVRKSRPLQQIRRLMGE